jgi:hypothetical protein
MLPFLFFLLPLIALVFGNNEPIGFKRSPNPAFVRKWSSTGMIGLDHENPNNSIEAVDLASKKTKKRIDVVEDVHEGRSMARVLSNN